MLIKQIRSLIAVGALVLTAFTFIGAVGNLHWAAELLSHPRPQYVLFLAVALFLLRCIKPARWDWFLLIPLAFNLWVIRPNLFTPTSAAQSADLTITHFNMNAYAADHSESLAYLNGDSAEILFLQEVTPWALPTIEAALSNYRLITAQPLKNTHGSALFVHRMAEVTISEPAFINLPESATRPLLTAIATVNGQPIRLLSLHVTRPRNAATSAGQSAEFEAVAVWAEEEREEFGRNILIIGDFNTTPWSNRFKTLLANSNLTNSQAGFGLQTSWPSQLPAPLRLPIDHVIHSPALTTVSRTTQRFSSSDHLLIQISIATNQ